MRCNLNQILPEHSDVDSEASRHLIRVQSKSRFALPYSWPNINWTELRLRTHPGVVLDRSLDCVLVQICLSSDLSEPICWHQN